MKQTISIQATGGLEKQSAEQLAKIDKALVAAAYDMRDKARKMFVNNGEGYKLDNLEDGILLGKLRHEGGDAIIALHSFGTTGTKGTPQYNTYKTRFFVGGTISRRTAKGRNKGYIKANNAVEKAANKSTLETFIKNAIK